MPVPPADAEPEPDLPTELSAEAPTQCDPEAATQITPFKSPEQPQPDGLADARHARLGSLGQGGMGEVLLVRDVRLQRQEAMKVISREEDPQRVARFLREARLTAQLEHPNIVPIHDVGRSADGRLYFTMKRVRGRSLREILSALKSADPHTETAFPLRRLLEIFQRVCHGVAYAHAQGVVHRDLKPANIMIGDFDEVLVMDWGLAKELGQLEPAAAAQQGADPSLEISTEGSLIGTLRYMPPEQAEGRLADIGPHSDIYALGAILYELLTLEYAQPGSGRVEVLMAILEHDPLPPEQRAPQRFVPRELSAVALRALRKNPERRYASVLELQNDVRAYLEGRRGRAWKDTRISLIRKWVRHNRRLALASLLASLLACVVLAGVAYNRLGPGSLRIRSQPPGARIWLDEREAGRTDAQLGWIWPGIHRVRLERDGYEPWQGEVEMPARGRVGLDRPLLADHGFLRVQCHAETRLLLDGLPVGTGGLDSLHCARGTHLLELQRAGHAPLLRQVEIPAGQLLNLGFLACERLTGALSLQTPLPGQRLRWRHPASAEGGELLAPLEEFRLPVGVVELRLWGRDIYTLRSSVQIDADQTERVFLAPQRASLWETRQPAPQSDEDSPAWVFGQPVLEDLDHDGVCDLLLPGYTGLRALRGGTGELLFERQDLALQTASVADVDGDGRNELVGLRQGRIQVWTLPDLQPLWRDPLRDEIFDLQLLQGPGELAVLAVGERGFVALRAGDGSELWRAARGNDVAGIGDLDGDGWDDVVGWIGGRLGWLRGVDGTLAVYLPEDLLAPAEAADEEAEAEAAGQAELAAVDEGRFPIFEAMALDFAGRGQAELVLLGRDALRLLSAQGVVRDSWQLGEGFLCLPQGMPARGALATGLWIVRADGRVFTLSGSPPILEEHCQLPVSELIDLVGLDLDADGSPELLSLSRTSGFQLMGWQIPASPGQVAQQLFELELDAPAYQLALAELTGDQTPELIVTGGRGPRVLQLPQLPLLWLSPTRTPLALADMNGDGRTDLLCRDWGLLALDAETGTPLWRNQEDARLLLLDPRPDPLLLVACADGRLLELDLPTGQELPSSLRLEVLERDYRHWLDTSFGLARDAQGRRHTLAWAHGAALYGLAFDGGVWQTELPWRIEPEPLEAGELVIEPQATAAGEAHEAAPSAAEGGGGPSAGPVLEVLPDADGDGVEDILVIGVDRLLAFSGRTGARLWQSRPGSQAWFPAVDADGDGRVEILELRTMGSEPRLQLLSGDSGAALWSAVVAGTPLSAFNLPGGGRCLLVQRYAPARLVAIEAETGHTLWEHGLPSGTLCDPQPGLWSPGGGPPWVYVAAEEHVWAFEPESGRRIWSRGGLPDARLEWSQGSLCVLSGSSLLLLDPDQGSCLWRSELSAPVQLYGTFQTAQAGHAWVVGAPAAGCQVFRAVAVGSAGNAHRYAAGARNHGALLRSLRDREAQAAIVRARGLEDTAEAARRARQLLAQDRPGAAPVCQWALAAEAAARADTTEVARRLELLLARQGLAAELLRDACALAYQADLPGPAQESVRRLLRRGSWELLPPGLPERQREALLWAASQGGLAALEPDLAPLLAPAAGLLQPAPETAAVARLLQGLESLEGATELHASTRYLQALLYQASEQPLAARQALESVPRSLRPHAFERALQAMQESIDRQQLRQMLRISLVERRDPRAPRDMPPLVHVEQFDADSRWARAGLRAGDAIIALDGKWDLSRAELEAELWLARGRRLRLMILRGEREGRLTVEP